MLDIPWLLHNVIHLVENHLLGKNGTNFPKLLWKLPTQRRSSLPWGPRPVPIENLNIFLFLYHQHKFTALFFSAHSTSTAHICWRWVVLPFADQTFRFRLGKFLGTVWQSKVWSVVQRKELSIGLSTKEQWLGLSTVLRTVNFQIMLWTVPFRLIITCVGS